MLFTLDFENEAEIAEGNGDRSEKCETPWVLSYFRDRLHCTASVNLEQRDFDGRAAGGAKLCVVKTAQFAELLGRGNIWRLGKKAHAETITVRRGPGPHRRGRVSRGMPGCVEADRLDGRIHAGLPE